MRLLITLSILISCGPSSRESSSDTTSAKPSCPYVRQTGQGICVVACNGAIACPSAIDLVTHDPNRKFRVRIER